MTTTDPKIAKSWRTLLLEIVFAHNYPIAYDLASASIGSVPRNPILETLLPSLLHVKAVALLDAALIAKFAEVGTKPKSHGFRNDLNGRIETAAALKQITDPTALHRIRGLRNDLAHEYDERITWDQLEADVDALNTALQELGYVGARPAFQVHGERVSKQELTDPKAVIGFNYSIQVREGDRIAEEMAWEQEFLGLGQS